MTGTDKLSRLWVGICDAIGPGWHSFELNPALNNAYPLLVPAVVHLCQNHRQRKGFRCDAGETALELTGLGISRATDGRDSWPRFQTNISISILLLRG